MATVGVLALMTPACGMFYELTLQKLTLNWITIIWITINISLFYAGFILMKFLNEYILIKERQYDERNF
jgi:hypothetical protein